MGKKSVKKYSSNTAKQVSDANAEKTKTVVAKEAKPSFKRVNIMLVLCQKILLGPGNPELGAMFLIEMRKEYVKKGRGAIVMYFDGLSDFMKKSLKKSKFRYETASDLAKKVGMETIPLLQEYDANHEMVFCVIIPNKKGETESGELGRLRLGVLKFKSDLRDLDGGKEHARIEIDIGCVDMDPDASMSEARDQFVRCSVCRSNMTKVKRCSLCKEVIYCSRECQIVDWAMHKKVCNKPATATATTTTIDE